MWIQQKAGADARPCRNQTSRRPGGSAGNRSSEVDPGAPETGRAGQYVDLLMELFGWIDIVFSCSVQNFRLINGRKFIPVGLKHRLACQSEVGPVRLLPSSTYINQQQKIHPEPKYTPECGDKHKNKSF